MPCHRCVTHSRKQEETGGHQRTRSRRDLSTGGHWRKPEDTGGYEIRPVRDREAPGSHPGPPTSPVSLEIGHRAPDQFLNSNFGAKDAKGGRATATTNPTVGPVVVAAPPVLRSLFALPGARSSR